MRAAAAVGMMGMIAAFAGGVIGGCSFHRDISGLKGTKPPDADAGAPIPCMLERDCPEGDGVCRKAVCDQGYCALAVIPVESQIYGDCHVTAKCGAEGALESVVDESDVYDDGNPCTDDGCKADGTPTHTNKAVGTPCPGSATKTYCSAEGTCVECTEDAHCPGTRPTCSKNKCIDAKTCGNGVRDGSETDVDCGGPSCFLCVDGSKCQASQDCQGSHCDVLASSTCQAPTCIDKIQNQGETGIDCGGPCAATGRQCTDGDHCALPIDCKSGVCKAGLCQVPSCTDGVQNGTETGIDCGGSCSTPCG